MADSGPIELDVFYDYMCPFVYRAAVMLDSVAALGGASVKVGWRYFSLAQVNSKDEGWTAWDAPESEDVRGRLAFKAAEAARRQGRFDDLHMPLLRARHRDRLDIDDVEVLERVAAEAGLDLERLRADMADATILRALSSDHRQGVAEYGVFGTPTFVFRDGAAAYVRLAGPFEGPEALEVFQHLMTVAADEPRIVEIKRPRKPTP